MNIYEKIKELINNRNSKSFINNLVIVLIIGIILMLTVSIFTDREQLKEDTPINASQKQSNTNDIELIENYTEQLENRLEEILSKIRGVGKVEVMVTLEDSAERIPAFNVTESQEQTNEKDAEGGTRNIIREDSTKQVVLNNGNSNDSLVIIKEVKPRVRGVIVVAEGAEDILVKEKLYSAVKTVLGIPGNKVEVYSSK
jgi:stage III sporulation protein AG